jgi:hypothetical protein
MKLKPPTQYQTVRFFNRIYRKRREWMIVVGLLMAILLLLDITVINRNIDKSAKIAYYENQIPKLQLENMLLQDKITKNSSLVSIEKWAYAHGFKPTTKLEWYQ